MSLTLTWGDIGTIVGILVVFGSLMAFVFRTKNDCGQCQSKCRTEVFDKISKAHENQSIYNEMIVQMNAKMDLLLMGLNIKVESKKDIKE